MAQLPVLRELVDVEVDTIVGDVCDSLVQQLLDEVNHLCDVLGGLRVCCRPPEVEDVEPPQEGLSVAISELLKGYALRPGVADGLVLYVRDVHGVEDIVAPVVEPPAQEVPYRECAEVAYVGVAVYSGATDVEPHLPFLYRYERLLTPCEGVVEHQALRLIACHV